MAVQKIYAGATLRETRARAGLPQRAFAERLGVSLPYLSQMENNHRPVSALVLTRLAAQLTSAFGNASLAGDDAAIDACLKTAADETNESLKREGRYGE